MLIAAEKAQRMHNDNIQYSINEYANYLVSMLNSGITVATLGIGNQNI